MLNTYAKEVNGLTLTGLKINTHRKTQLLRSQVQPTYMSGNW